jgi:antitoxin component of MazEF toxin-antitoxin module
MFYCCNPLGANEMPIIRKLVSFGNSSKGIILPKSWLTYYERKSGQKIREVAVEVNGKLTIRPILKEGK